MLYQFGPETRVVTSAHAARPIERAAAYLQAQVAQRTGWRWPIEPGGAAEPCTIAIGIPGDGTPAAPLVPEYAEEIALTVSGAPAAPVATVLAGGLSVALAAVGRFARALDLRPGVAGVPALSLREHPAFPVRGHTLANHKQNNTYDKWDWEHWEGYLTELAAWGSNLVVLYPLHPARWPDVLPFAVPPWFASAAHEAASRL